MQTLSNAKAPDVTSPWAPYVPTDDCPWNLRRVVHLHRCAGFAATWGEIQRDLKDGPHVSIDRVLAGKSATDGVPEEFHKTADLLGEAAAPSGDPARLKAWWIYRMLFGPDPLTERLALLWHNHFATSNLKVENLAFLRRQNELFRKLGRGPFGELLSAVVHDPAMLVWLDAPSNRTGHPNENLARELMELFSMGVGHFTEADVKEAARALTGWSLEEESFIEVSVRHDAGEKTILGHRGPWKGDDLVRMVLEHPATSHRLAWRICELFLGEEALKTADMDSLAEGLRSHNLNIGWAVETVLRSKTFFAEQNLGHRVLSPVEYVVGAARALELFDPPFEHASAGRVVRPAGAGSILPTQCWRLARRPVMADHTFRHWPSQLCSRLDRGHACRPPRADGCTRPGTEARGERCRRILHPAAAGNRANTGVAPAAGGGH